MTDLHEFTVRRRARVAVLGEPMDADETWFVLHGYGQLAADFLGSFEALASPRRAIVAPEALSRFYLRSGSGRHTKLNAQSLGKNQISE